MTESASFIDLLDSDDEEQEGDKIRDNLSIGSNSVGRIENNSHRIESLFLVTITTRLDCTHPDFPGQPVASTNQMAWIETCGKPKRCQDAKGFIRLLSSSNEVSTLQYPSHLHEILTKDHRIETNHKVAFSFETVGSVVIYGSDKLSVLMATSAMEDLIEKHSTTDLTSEAFARRPKKSRISQSLDDTLMIVLDESSCVVEEDFMSSTSNVVKRAILTEISEEQEEHEHILLSDDDGNATITEVRPMDLCTPDRNFSNQSCTTAKRNPKTAWFDLRVKYLQNLGVEEKYTDEEILAALQTTNSTRKNNSDFVEALREIRNKPAGKLQCELKFDLAESDPVASSTVENESERRVVKSGNKDGSAKGLSNFGSKSQQNIDRSKAEDIVDSAGLSVNVANIPLPTSKSSAGRETSKVTEASMKSDKGPSIVETKKLTKSVVVGTKLQNESSKTEKSNRRDRSRSPRRGPTDEKRSPKRPRVEQYPPDENFNRTSKFVDGRLKTNMSGAVSDGKMSPQMELSRYISSKLKYIIIDGSNVAMSHGNDKVFSCRGIKLAVDYFLRRGHREITVFVPQWRRKVPTMSRPLRDQWILDDLKRKEHLVFTPSRTVGGRHICCHDDRYILRLAQYTRGIIVSNDQFLDFQRQKVEWRKMIAERVLQFSFVLDYFMVPDDPLGLNGPDIDDFLLKTPQKSRSGR